MQGNLEVLDRGAARDPGLLAESLADMRREVARLIRMANDLLLLAQSEAGVQLRREPVELDTLLLEVHRELRPLADGIQLRIGEEDQIVVQGDRDRIKQALLNLVVNALQHTPPGGSVTLALARADGKAALTVASGAGIGSTTAAHLRPLLPRRPSRSRNCGRGRPGPGDRRGAGSPTRTVAVLRSPAHQARQPVHAAPAVLDEPLEYELRS
jgi:signal transduction histidine kinase